METTTPTVSFFDSIAPFVKLSPESRKALLSLLKKESLPKGHVLVPCGDICRSVYYIERGLARTFYLKDGKEITDRFRAENSFTCSMSGYVTNTPDGRQIELIEPSVIWSLPYVELEKLYDQFHDIERLGRYLITQEMVEIHRRLGELQFIPAQERYNNLVANQPSLLQRVPLGYISSYLGITQETLSRIRAKV
ncbi:Crp/Fnr family transcriptional regulator [Flavobacterium sp. MFBS3-15]|uniref:Crp/Fnr family transcriptional regulator n=1 Tax=Flavobacterium sp. MFBS3-15 TaxID=2989816 RepID=UPI002235AC23|nr:Crp/Fnr family transcriptional regulator [Flavobacterium sp. MFBS3-15]MCW4470081.1 Crp/Fnr family transcriptional regulator [Flavobacterium sp. MFBS3-15]